MPKGRGEYDGWHESDLDHSYHGESDTNKEKYRGVEGRFSRQQGYAVILITLLGLGIPFGTWMFGYSPYFHSRVPNPNYTHQDPYTYLWQTSLTQCLISTSSEFNIQNAACVAAGTAPCPMASGPCLQLQAGTPTASNPAIVLTKTIVDLSSANGKELGLNFAFTGASSNNAFLTEIYLTQNGTVPSNNPTYSPLDDKAVVFNISYDNSGGSGTATITVQQLLKAGDTINSESAGCGGSDSSCFGQYTNPVCHTGGGGDYNYIGVLLNYTGSQTAGGGISTATTHVCGGANGTVQLANTFPQLLLTGNYYVGFFEKFIANTQVLTFQANVFTGCTISSLFTTVNCMALTNAVPSGPIGGIVGPQPTVDSGGFFGAVGRFLAPVGNFLSGVTSTIWVAVSNPLAGLAGAVLNAISSGFALFATTIINVMNAVGNFWGLGNVGTDIANFFTAVAGFLSTILTGIFAFFVNSVTFLSNGASAIGTFFTATNFLTLWIGFLGGLPALINALDVFLGFVLFYYNLGLFGFNIIIIFSLIILALAALVDYEKSGNPIALFTGLVIAFWTFYVMTLPNTALNIIATNPTILSNYQTAFNQTVFFVKLAPVLFVLMLANYMTTETFEHQAEGFMSNFVSTLKFYIMITVDAFKAGHFILDFSIRVIVSIKQLVAGWL